MKVLIIEDETRAANRLKKLIRKLEPELIITGVLDTVRDSIRYLSENRDIGLLFSDIQLADGLSFEIYESIDVPCPIIFTTAFDQYAVEAFRTNGIDYLLKPVEEDRLKTALDKMKRLSAPTDKSRIKAVAQSRHSANTFKSRFMVRVGDRIRSITIDKIKAFYSMEKATFLLNEEGRSYIVDFSLDMLESILDPELFFRINRKYIVSIDACTDMLLWKNSRLKIRIPGLKTDDVIVARERVSGFKEWLDR